MSDQPTSPDGQRTLDEAKKVEYYSQGVAAWFNSALEHDKSLLTLSVAGIGFLVSMMQSAIDSILALLLYAGAILAFLVCLVSVLMIFKRNKKHILDVLNGQTEDDPVLGILDSSASISFFVAMLFAVMLGFSLAISTYIEKGKTMANDKSIKTTQPVATADSAIGFATPSPAPSKESFNQMAAMQKSFQGMAQLQGQKVPQGTQTAPEASQAQAPSVPKSGSTNK